MDNSIKITLIIVGALFLMFGIGSLMFYSIIPGPLKGETISVTGNSVVKVTPDLVTVYLNVETNGSSAQIAKDENAKIVDEVITSLVKKGFAREDIETLNFNIYPWQEWENNKYVSKGYKTSHQIRIELKENKFSLVGDVIDAGADAGAMISTINFELSTSKQNEYKALALKQAGQEAKIKADAIAEGVGKRVGALVSISTNEWGYNPWNVYTSSYGGMADVAMAKETATNISPSTQEISGSLTAVYRLK